MSNLGLDYLQQEQNITEEMYELKKIKHLQEQLELKRAEIQVLRKELDALRDVCTEMTRQRNRVQSKLEAANKPLGVVRVKNGKLIL